MLAEVATGKRGDGGTDRRRPWRGNNFDASVFMRGDHDYAEQKESVGARKMGLHVGSDRGLPSKVRPNWRFFFIEHPWVMIVTLADIFQQVWGQVRQSQMASAFLSNFMKPRDRTAYPCHENSSKFPI